MSIAGERPEVGPVDVDSAGELVKKVGVHNQAKRLIKSVAQNFPPELVAAISRRELGGQTQTLDLGEVADAADDAFDDFDELLGASVRGSEERPDTIVVSIVFRTESGRSARGALPYADLKKSQRAYAKGVQDGTVVIREDDPEANRKALEEAQKRIVELQKQVEEGGAPADPEPEPEPYEGYADAKAAERVEAIESGDLSLAQLFAIRAAQEAESKPQKTVVEAVEAKIEAAEAAVRGGDAGDGD